MAVGCLGAWAPFGEAARIPAEGPCCGPTNPGVVWSGTKTTITLEELAAYCGPVLWFSPDEPLIEDADKTGIRVPQAFPFEDSVATPLVYFRVRTVVTREDASGPALEKTGDARESWLLHLDRLVLADLDYFFYYPSEAGLGGHRHDVESVQIKVGVRPRPDCPDCPYEIVVARVVGKAHGLLWYDNNLDVDEAARFPMHILVEEGKHASCTDANADGAFTPGYDVNVRVNDAWGVRDIIRGGALYTGGFQSWNAKTRRLEDRIFPPLPPDSPLRNARNLRLDEMKDTTIYALRPFPSAEKAEHDLVHFIADKGEPDWPEETDSKGLSTFSSWVEGESFAKTLSIAYRYDSDSGVSFVFPLFIVKTFNEPMGGGWISNRIYLKDDHLRDWSWGLLYTPSASRWIDPYLSLGIEWDNQGGDSDVAYGVTESGIKFRANVSHSKQLKFMAALTDFWGIRLGLKATALFPVKRWDYVLEVGAGTF